MTFLKEKKILTVISILGIGLVTGCGRSSQKGTPSSPSGGFLDSQDGTTVNYNMTLGMSNRLQFPSQVSFIGESRFPFPADDQNYVIGVGLTTKGTNTNVERLEVIARPLFADGSLGDPVRFVNGSNKNATYTPSQGWDFAWFAGDTSSRILTGISFSSSVSQASIIKRKLGPGPAVGDAVNYSLPSGSNYSAVKYFTVPDYNYAADRSVASTDRLFFVIVGLYLKGQNLRIDQVEIHNHQLFAQWNPITGQVDFFLGNPRKEILHGFEGVKRHAQASLTAPILAIQ